MAKIKINQELNSSDEISVKSAKSSVGEFVKRALPTEEDVEKFEEYAEQEAREEEIEESLSEIYHDKKGDLVDVKTLDIKKGKGIIAWIFTILIFMGVLGGIGYAAYYYIFLGAGSDSKSIKLEITAEENIVAGQEFFYTIEYKNLSNVDIENIEIEADYPDNFIFVDSVPAAQEGKNNLWLPERVAAHQSGEIKVKGKIIDIEDSSNIILARMNYMPANFSSTFKKEAAFETKVVGTGIDFTFENQSNILVGEKGSLTIKYKASGTDSFLKNFKMTAEGGENLEIVPPNKEESGSFVWKAEEITEQEQEFKVDFSVKEKNESSEDINLIFSYSEDGEKYFEFLKKSFSIEVIKNDLNLTLIMEGERDDQGIDFGQTLNYSIVYANKGEAKMEDVVIMAVLDSKILDWQTLSDENLGQVGDKTITWTKEEIPALEAVEKGQEGTIDFSVEVLSAERVNINPIDKFEVKSYAQFSIGNIDLDSEDTKSNIITGKVNSDLSLDEQVRYFNDDNIAVGSGPLPPKVGQATSYKIYWVVTNNLHEITDLKIETTLPANVVWDDKNRSTVGNLSYDAANHKVTWDIGRLPVSVYKTEAEFSIAVTPTDNDRDKILVLVSNTNISGADKETGAAINKTSKALTTRLERDTIAETDGRVE